MTLLLASVNGPDEAEIAVAQGAEGTGSGSRVIQLTAGQVLRVMGAQDGNAAPISSSIISGPDGRTRLTMARLAA